jgi:hypothetical protein
LDQFISLLFETLNSRGEKQFRNLFEDAYNGSISKDVFVNTIRRLEFAQTLNARALLLPLHFSKKEIKQSHDYKILMDCPLDYQGFLAYLKVVAPKRNMVEEYEDEYDELRKQNLNAKSEGKAKPEPQP